MKAKLKRSKNGCQTCRRRKVKCDETQPNCEECSRLKLVCRWSLGKQPSIKSFRRGHGPIKSRTGTWVPSPIAPTAREPILTEPEGDVSTPESDWSNPLLVEMESRPDEWTRELNGDRGDFTFFESLNSPFNLENSQMASISPEPVKHPQMLTDYSQTDHQISYDFLAMGPIPSLSDFHMTLPNSLQLSLYEHEALRHYQTTYSLYRTTKDPNWSTHKVLLHMGSQEKMIMHLLLAVSLNDYSNRTGYASSSQEAESNFREGAELLISTSSHGLKKDKVVMMAAYFFLYLYMSKRKSTATQQLSQLSLTALNYVKKHNLLQFCIGSPTSTEQLSLNTVTSSHNRSLLARLIMWTLDEDVKCSFQGSGGHFARHLTRCDAKTKDIYDVSRNALGDHWGALYPHSQVLDDDQNSTVLEFLWALMELWQDINDLCQESEPSDLASRIEQKFILLEEKYSSVFRHSSEVTNPRSRILVNADYDVVLFHALRVYYFRSTISDLAMKTPQDIENSLNTVLTIIQRTFCSRSTELHDRLQWPLFLAGMETSNAIYREWIFSRLTSDRVAAALQNTLDAQAFVGHRLTMAEVRNLLYTRVEPRISAMGSAYLSAIPAIV